MTYKIHLAGSFGPEDVRADWAPSTFGLPAEVAGEIESAWAAAVGQRGTMLFDGPMCRVEGWRREGKRLRLSLSRTSYKWFWGTNLHRPQLGERYGAAALANALGLSAMVESADGYFLLGRRSGAVAYHPHRVHPFAGSATGLDVFAEMRRELAEELALAESDIAEMTCIGMAEDRAIRQPELVFRVLCTHDCAEIERALDLAEHTQLVAIRPDDQPSDDWTPIAVAALALRRQMHQK